MERSRQDAPALDYESPLDATRRSSVRPWLLAVVSFLVATAAGDGVLDAFRRRELTQAYTQYMVTQSWLRGTIRLTFRPALPDVSSFTSRRWS